MNILKNWNIGKLENWFAHNFSHFPYLILPKNALGLRVKSKEQGTKRCRDAKQPFNFTIFQLYNLIPYIVLPKNALRLCSFAPFAGNRSAQTNFPIFRFSNFSIPKYLLIYSFTHLLIGCTNNTYTPKPAAYPRIEFPEKKYVDYQDESCHFSARVPQYATVEADKSRGAEPCWFNINFPEFNAKIHLSYKPVSSFKNFYEMSEDAHTFAYKHTVKAEDIYDSAFHFRENRTSGFLFSIEGNTASAIQFYATDSSKHYLRGALYFNAQPNKDSLQPVVNFIRADIDTLLKSLRWK